MEKRKLKQYGWISGPVECCCTACDWIVSFTASDSSLPGHIVSAFAEHNCSDYCEPEPVMRKQAQL